jgi:sulfatase modifying factor 1
MRQKPELSRRDILTLTGVSVSALLLGSCARESMITDDGMPAGTPSASPSITPLRSTPTPASTAVPRAMILIEAGTFLMGSDDGFPNERPVHQVKITRPFLMGTHIVTIDQYDRYCARVGKSLLDDRGWGRGNRPAIGLTWVDAVEYCTWLSEIEGLDPCYSGVRKNTECDFLANGYRLPTEAEWEFAARGGNYSEGYRLPGSDDPLEVAWYEDNSGGMTHPVGQLKPNELGLHDMCGNGSEWCWDWYASDYYVYSPVDDPTGLAQSELPESQFEQVKSKRGGFYNESAEYIYSTFRTADNYNYPGGCIRLVRTAS